MQSFLKGVSLRHPCNITNEAKHPDSQCTVSPEFLSKMLTWAILYISVLATEAVQLISAFINRS